MDGHDSRVVAALVQFVNDAIRSSCLRSRNKRLSIQCLFDRRYNMFDCVGRGRKAKVEKWHLREKRRKRLSYIDSKSQVFFMTHL